MRILLSLPLLLGACTLPEPKYGSTPALLYEAFGTPPLWRLSISDERVLLTLHDPALGPTSTSFSGVRPVAEGETTRWSAGGGGPGGIFVEARREPCTGADGRRYEDSVTVRLRGQQLEGCGGKRLPGRSG